MASNPYDFLKAPNGEPSAANAPFESSPLGPQDTPQPTALSEQAEQLRDAEMRRGGPVRREERADPRPRQRHMLRPVSEMPEAQESTPLHIDKSDFPDDFDLQWITTSVLGQPQASNRMKHERRGWESLRGDDFGGRYDGRWTAPGDKGEITVDGMTLMARPKTWSDKARKDDQRAAQAAVRVKQEQLGAGELPGVAGAGHPSARSFNHLRKRTERLDVPNEGIVD
jgi:hypothetical protein